MQTNTTAPPTPALNILERAEREQTLLKQALAQQQTFAAMDAAQERAAFVKELQDERLRLIAAYERDRASMLDTLQKLLVNSEALENLHVAGVGIDIAAQAINVPAWGALHPAGFTTVRAMVADRHAARLRGRA
jgi:hypothetical protein